MNELTSIERTECLRLLAEHSFGRLAVRGRGQAPIIRPINYLFDIPSQSVVFRTAEGSKLHGLLVAETAAFEVDGVDPQRRTGWSVIVTGVAEEITNPLELRRLEHQPLDPWDPADKPHWMRIRAGTISGRRIASSRSSEEPPPARSPATSWRGASRLPFPAGGARRRRRSR